VERPQIPVGKLDVKQVFQPSAPPEDKVGAVVGKLDTRNLFPAPTGTVDEKPTVTVGKLDARNLFPAATTETADEINNKPAVVVGKLDIKNLFAQPSTEKEERPAPTAGKLNVKNIFPIIAAPEEKSPPITVGKLDAKSLFPGAESGGQQLSGDDRPRPPAVGRLNTTAIFNSSPTEVESEHKLYRPTVQPRRLKVDNIFTAASGTDFNPVGIFLFKCFFFV
jgi:hypothetical protein